MNSANKVIHLLDVRTFLPPIPKKSVVIGITAVINLHRRLPFFILW